MSDWQELRISELATIDIGGTPSRAIPAFWADKPGGHPWISIADLKGKYVSETKEHITALGVRSSNVKLIPKNTTVMSFKLTVGRTAITGNEMFCNEAIAIFQPKDDRLHGPWLYHALPRAATSVVTDTAVKGATLNKAKMAEMTLNLPPPREQIKIAQVLDTLDTAIHETEAIIAKLKAVKQGLLHDLLTRGIDANGQLRPPQAEAPHLYKPSPLGWIPKEWEQTNLGARVGFLGGYGFPERYQNCAEGEIPFFKVSDQSIPGNERELRLANNYVSRERARKQGWKLSPKNGVAFAKVGAALLLNRRRLLAQESLVDNNMMVAIAVEGVDPIWLYWLLQMVDFRLFVQSGALPSVNQSQLSTLPVAFPSVHEQAAIAARLDQIDEKADLEQNDLGKLHELKAGLMHDLLTGRVRVTPLLQEPQPA